jgi:hypothetical protein
MGRVLQMAFYHYAEIIVTYPQLEIRDYVDRLLTRKNKYSVKWNSMYEGLACEVPGYKNSLFEYRLRLYEFVFVIFPLRDGKSVIRLIKPFIGPPAGLLGWWENKNLEHNFLDLVDYLTKYFSSLGYLENTLFF